MQALLGRVDMNCSKCRANCGRQSCALSCHLCICSVIGQGFEDTLATCIVVVSLAILHSVRLQIYVHNRICEHVSWRTPHIRRVIQMKNINMQGLLCLS